MNKFSKFIIAGLTGLILFAGFLIAQNAVAAAPVVVLAGDGTVYLVEGGVRRGFPTLSVFYSHGYKLSNIQPASLADLSLPAGSVMSYAEGSLILDASGTVYQITGGEKHGFTSAQAFYDRGYNFFQVLPDSGARLAAIPAGSNLDPIIQVSTPGPATPPSSGSAATVKVLYPNGGEQIASGMKIQIKWTQSNVNAVTIGYKTCDSCFDTIINSLAVERFAAEGVFLWTVPNNLALSSSYKIEVRGHDIGVVTVNDQSDAPFTLLSSGAVITSASLDPSTPASAVYVSGAKNAVFARIRVNALGGDVTLDKLSAVSDSQNALSQFVKIHFYDGGALLGTTFGFDTTPINPVVVPNGSYKIITVASDLTPGITGSLRLGLFVNNEAIYGETMRISASGTMTLGLDSTSPVSRDVTGGNKEITAAVFKISASSEDAMLQSLGLEVATNNVAAVSKVTVWDGATQIGQLSSLRGSVTLNPPVIVPKGGSRVLAVRVDIPIVDVTNVKIGETIRVSYDLSNPKNTKAIGQVSGQEIYPTNSFAGAGNLITLRNSASELYGDVNHDSLVMADDAALIDKHVAGTAILSGRTFTNADVTGDGKVNKIDSLLVTQYAGLRISAFPINDGTAQLFGDANRDGRVTMEDSVLINSYLGGRSQLLGRALDNADVTGDGDVAADDEAAVADYAGGKISSFTRGKVAGEIVSASNQPPAVPTVNGFQDIVYANYVQNIWGYSIDPDRDSVSYEIWWGDGTKFFSPIMPHQYAFFAQHTWSQPGSYQIMVKAADGKGGFGITSFYIWIR